MIGGRVLDSSTLVDFALVRPYPQALVWTAVEEGMVLAIPATALATAWALVPASAADALQVLLDLPNTVVEPLEGETARAVGELLAGGLPRDAELVRVGQVVVCGVRRGWPIVTGEPGPLRRLNPTIDLDPLP